MVFLGAEPSMREKNSGNRENSQTVNTLLEKLIGLEVSLRDRVCSYLVPAGPLARTPIIGVMPFASFAHKFGIFNY